MKTILPAIIFLFLLTSCTRKMFPDNTLGQTSGKTSNGGVIYPDGSIHYPDGSVRTTDGMVWPANTNERTSKNKNIADDPNVTVVSRSSGNHRKIENKTNSSPVLAKSTAKKNRPANPDDNTDIAVVTSKGYPDYETTEEIEDKKKSSPEINTSARKDETGRHARKRGE